MIVQSPDNPPPCIPDHELLRCVGRGAYGEVWLARSILGAWRAIKVVRRANFDHDRPFQREFLGIRKFEPIARTHAGLVAILHVGRNLTEGYFYYVMEVADDAQTNQDITSDTYSPRTLASELRDRGRLPFEECLCIGLALSSALNHLHERGLVHRDIKPANIIFVNGAPKLADIGLVTTIGDHGTFVGTPGFIPPEGPGSPTADIFSLGMVLYQIGMGKGPDEFPELPTRLNDESAPHILRLNQIILKACDRERRNRYQSASELRAALAEVGGVAFAPGPSAIAATRRETRTTSVSAGMPLLSKPFRVCLLYRSNVEPDDHVLKQIQLGLVRHEADVFMDKHLAIGVEWAREIEAKIRGADAVIVLLSGASVQSEMLAYEVELAHQAAQQQQGRPLLLPVRVQYTGLLPGVLGPILDPLHYFLWEGPQDDEHLTRELLRALETSQKPAAPDGRVRLESIGGAVPLDSQFYVVRPTDHEFQTAMARRDGIVLVKGARQMGKTSLLARGLQQARHSGAKVVLTDFQKFNAAHLVSIESFFLTLGKFLADQLDLAMLPEEAWDKRRSPNANFERYLRREVLAKMEAHVVWGLDEVDRLFTCDFGSEVFGLFRSWHNERALDPAGPWSRLTLVIAYATEAHLFITDINQSPFNVGTRLALHDFTSDQFADLNRRYGSPLKTVAEVTAFYNLVGGQPYLAHRGLNELASGSLTFSGFVAHADRDEGIYGDHLRRMLVLLAKDPELTEVVRGVLRGRSCANSSSFYRLRSAGVMKGDTPQQIEPRCGLYAAYLKGHLL